MFCCFGFQYKFKFNFKFNFNFKFKYNFNLNFKLNISLSFVCYTSGLHVWGASYHDTRIGGLLSGPTRREDGRYDKTAILLYLWL